VIAQISGILLDKAFTRVVIETSGIGFEISVPLSTFDRLPRAGEAVTLHTVLHVREDAMQLFGFHSLEERALFQLLIQTVSGVGPKLALNVLSSMSPGVFAAAVQTGDVKRLTQINGIGKRSAERLVVELKDKLDDVAPSIGGNAAAPTGGDDAVAALVTLGFKQDSARKAVASLLSDNPDAGTDDLIRLALAALNR
jgi:Holliday junction DNA helicase RuvA